MIQQSLLVYYETTAIFRFWIALNISSIPLSLFSQEPVFASVYSISTPQYIMCFNQVTVSRCMVRSVLLFALFDCFVWSERFVPHRIRYMWGCFFVLFFYSWCANSVTCSVIFVSKLWCHITDLSSHLLCVDCVDTRCLFFGHDNYIISCVSLCACLFFKHVSELILMARRKCALYKLQSFICFIISFDSHTSSWIHSYNIKLTSPVFFHLQTSLSFEAQEVSSPTKNQPQWRHKVL